MNPYSINNASQYASLNIDRSNEEGKSRQRYRQSAQIRYHTPYERLAKRKMFGQIIKKFIRDQQLLKMDNFALFDAVYKRGGYQQVYARNRWDEIGICLQYEKKLWGFAKYFQDNLLPFEPQIILACNWQARSVLYEAQVFQMHLITPNNLTTSYYHMTASEYMLAESSFSSFDQYLNIKTLALTNADISKISVDYAEKYVILKKWLLFSGQIKCSTVKQIRVLGIPETVDRFRVAIIGLSLNTLLIADKLSDLGVRVTIFDKGKKESRLKDQCQIIENGLMILQGGNNKGSYCKHLQSNLITLEDIVVPSIGMQVLDEEGKAYSEQKIRSSEEHFFGIIEELKGELMSKKNLYEQVVTRMLRKKLQYERFLIKWHYDRYMTFNRIKGDCTTVGDLATYESKKFIKHIAQTCNLSIVVSAEKLLAKVKEKKNISFIQNSIDYVSNQNDIWSIHYRSETINASHLIYADQETIFKGVHDGNPKLPQVNGEIIGESLSILQQLTGMKYINCLFRFRQKIVLKQQLKNQTCFSICCAHGFIYFFVLNNSTYILAILKCYLTSNINYYSQILNILQTKCLVKNNRLINEELYSYQYTFGIRDQKYMEAIIRIKQLEKMFLFLPITTTNCPHRMTAQIDMANYICGNILDEIYPSYQNFDPSFKEQFLQKIQTTSQTPILSIKASKEREGSGDRQKWKKQKEGILNTPLLSVSKSIKSEQLARMKIIIAVANQKNEGNISMTQGEVPSILALSQMQDDWFGIKHPFVKRYEEFVKNRIQMSSRQRQGLKNLSLFAIRQTFTLYPGTILHSIGNPYLKESQWFSSILTNALSTPDFIFCLNGFTTRREYISLFDTFRTTIYYQTILIIEGQTYYCIIDQENTKVKYYHTDLTTLISIFNKKLEEIREDEVRDVSRSYANFKVTRCKFTEYPPKELLLSKITKQIKQQLVSINEPTLDSVLTSKLQEAYEGIKFQKFMGSQHQIFIQDKYQMAVQHSASYELIYKQITEYVDLMNKIHQLKSFTLFDIFFGILDQQYIACEIMKKFTREPLTYFDLQKLDEPLSKEIQQIFSKNIPNEIYSIMIIPEQGDVLFHRNFIHTSNIKSFQRYTFMRSNQFKGNESIIRCYMLDQNMGKMQFNNTQNMMKEIIKRLVENYQQQFIIQQFETLINHEIEKQSNLSPRVKMYFRMTKKSITEVHNGASAVKFSQKCKDLNQNQRMSAYNLMKRKKMRWVQNQVVFIIK